ncbi:MAG: 3-oxoacyl-[acyl-carrier-protein] reductase FabG [Anaerolineae bacterium]|nr:3-oxoacyl-[acyl-carrier-protein] reductase FabG [Anaerolineae bacterium]
MARLKGKIALVTGGSRGIGRAIALDLAINEADVAFTYRQNEVEAQSVVEQVTKIGRRCLAIRAEVTDFEKAGQVVEQVQATWGGLDILVNNAGIHHNEAIWAMNETQWDAVLEVNLKGVFNYIRAAASIFRAQKSGKIINIASIHGLRGRQEGANYSAAKAGVIGLTKSVARDLGPYQVNVNVVAPGIIETDLVRAIPPELRERFIAETVLGRIGQVEDVAYLVTFLASDQARHITGEVIKVDGGQYI